MALFDTLFRSGRVPGWMSRGRGKVYTDICLLAFDGIVEGFYQARLNLFGVDPHPSAVPHIAADTGIPNGFYETIRSYVLRMRRRNWSWRAAGLAGVADLHVDALEWVLLGGAVPKSVSGYPTEAGNILRIDVDGFVGPGSSVMYSISTDGGATFGASTALNANTTIAVGGVTLGFNVGDLMPAIDLPLLHGGRGLRLNDFGAPIRGNVAASSPAGDESILHEIAQQVGQCRIRLVSQLFTETRDILGTWWTREANGYTWRLSGGPWAWEESLDEAKTHVHRGIVIIDNPPEILPWEVIGVESHYLDEPQASYGTTAQMEWWNRLYVTVFSFKPAHMRVCAIILNFDSTKFDPSDSATCMQSNWINEHDYDVNGNVFITRPVEYAWFSWFF